MMSVMAVAEVLPSDTTDPQDELRKAYQEAIDVWRGGACNGRAIARALVRIYDAEGNLGGTTRSNESPAALLVLDQLCHLSGQYIERNCFKAYDEVKAFLANDEDTIAIAA